MTVQPIFQTLLDEFSTDGKDIEGIRSRPQWQMPTLNLELPDEIPNKVARSKKPTAPRVPKQRTTKGSA